MISAFQNAAELFQLLLDMRVVAGNVAADFLHHVKEQAQVHGLVEQAFQGGGKAALDLEFVRLAQIFADHGKFLPEGVAHPLGVFLGFAAAFVEECGLALVLAPEVVEQARRPGHGREPRRPQGGLPLPSAIMLPR